MSDTVSQKGGTVCRTGAWQIDVYWLTLGDNGDFRQSSRIGQFVAKNERGLAKKKPAAVAKMVMEEFPALSDVIVTPRLTYGEAAWLRG